MEQPTRCAELILDSILVRDSRDCLSGQRGRRGSLDFAKEPVDDRNGKIEIPAVVGELSEFGGELGQSRVEILASDGEALEEKERVEDAVALGQVESERVSAAFLSARDRVACVHAL